MTTRSSCADGETRGKTCAIASGAISIADNEVRGGIAADSGAEEDSASSDEDSCEGADDNQGARPRVLAPACECLRECAGRPTMVPLLPGSKVFLSASTPCSRTLAAQVRQAALATTRIHGYSTAGTPWLHARRVAAIKTQNHVFLEWCREWISELYGVRRSAVCAPKTEPHIVKYSEHKKRKFKGIGTHQDGSFVTVILALSHNTEYTGGGTYFAHLDKTVTLEQGEVLLFQGQQGPYSAPHRAQPISSGSRVLYIAFFSLKKSRALRSSRRRQTGAVEGKRDRRPRRG